MPSSQSDSDNGLFSLSSGQMWELWKVLGHAGLDAATAKRLLSDPSFVKRLVEAAREGAIQETLTQHRAGAYFLQNYFGPADWWRYLKTPLTYEHLRLVEYFPWPVQLADQPCPFTANRNIWKTHVVFPMWVTVGSGNWQTNLDLRWLFQQTPLLFQPGGEKYLPWFMDRQESDGLALQTSWVCRWYCVLLAPPKELANMTLEEQTQALPANYEPAPLVVATAAHLLYRLKNGQFADMEREGRCSHPTPTFPGDGGYALGLGASGLKITVAHPTYRSQDTSFFLMRRLPAIEEKVVRKVT